MELTFLNVGYGESILIRHQSKTILIDGGSAYPQEYTVGNRISTLAYLQNNAITSIDVLIITHIHEDHVGGLMSVLDHVEIGEIWCNVNPTIFSAMPLIAPPPQAPKNIRQFTDALNTMTAIVVYAQRQKIPVHCVAPHQSTYTLQNDGLTFTFLAPRIETISGFEANLQRLKTHPQESSILLQALDCASNDTSLVCKLFDGNDVCIFTGDSCPPNYANHLALAPPISVFKLPHHGQRDCLDMTLMQRLQPHYVVTSSASDRRNNSAHPGVYTALQTALAPSTQYLFTDEISYPPFFQADDATCAITLQSVHNTLTYIPTNNNKNGGRKE